ncbi:MAG: RusA family crossover junction endodeoxyribonuclease [Cyanobacteriota bacterium]|nr:RusA family crossover junction endodeoxyribonuclease [Cyanobacteriota bacterium]
MNSPLNVLKDSIFTLLKRDDYDPLDQLASRIHQEHQRCIQSPKTSLIHACNAGACLLKAQPSISPQAWEKWLRNRCNLTKQTAQLYMRMARQYPQVESKQISDKQLQNKQIQNKIEPKIETLSPTPLTKKPVNPPQTQPKTIGFPRLLAQSPPQQKTPVQETPFQAEPVQSSASKVAPSQPKSQPKSAPASAKQSPREESIIDVDFTPVPAKSQPKSTPDFLRFYIQGAVVPKARPRVTANGTYMPNRYREWRNRAEIELYRQMSEMRSTYKFPLQKAAIALRFLGNHRTNSDLDNMAGACLDALTLNGAGVLMDDRISCLPKLSVEYVSGANETGVWIEIQPL